MKDQTVPAKRCGWLNQDPVYIEYHDDEWGKPVYDNIRLFEMICLEGQQAGLSWITVLKKRENYRKIFFNFDPYKIANLTDNDQQEIVKSPEIVRHKGKINAIINNAKCYIEMEKRGEDFSKFVWSFVENKPILKNWHRIEEIPTQTSASEELSNTLKQRGFRYVGPTICYSFMQACGLINDHVTDCICYKKYA